MEHPKAYSYEMRTRKMCQRFDSVAPIVAPFLSYDAFLWLGFKLRALGQMAPSGEVPAKYPRSMHCRAPFETKLHPLAFSISRASLVRTSNSVFRVAVRSLACRCIASLTSIPSLSSFSELYDAICVRQLSAFVDAFRGSQLVASFVYAFPKLRARALSPSSPGNASALKRDKSRTKNEKKNKPYMRITPIGSFGPFFSSFVSLPRSLHAIKPHSSGRVYAQCTTESGSCCPGSRLFGALPTRASEQVRARAPKDAHVERAPLSSTGTVRQAAPQCIEFKTSP